MQTVAHAPPGKRVMDEAELGRRSTKIDGFLAELAALYAASRRQSYPSYLEQLVVADLEKHNLWPWPPRDQSVLDGLIHLARTNPRIADSLRRVGVKVPKAGK